MLPFKSSSLSPHFSDADSDDGPDMSASLRVLMMEGFLIWGVVFSKVEELELLPVPQWFYRDGDLTPLKYRRGRRCRQK